MNNNYPLPTIGTIEAVSLPGYGVENILAKIDTGADSSAIWANHILEKNGKLEFILFGPTSPYYTGEVIKTSKFSKVLVKNSFGHKELRYKVDIKVLLNDRTIKARFTLANRSNNRFPILIGRRTVKGKFLVDASRRNPSLGNQRTALLLAKLGNASEAYVEALASEGLDIERITYDQLVFNLGGEGSNSISVDNGGEDLSSYSLVYFRTSNVYGHTGVSSAIAQYLSNRHTDFIDKAVVFNPDPPKLHQYVLLSDNGVNIPKTIFMLPSRLQSEYEKLVADLGLPFVLKDINGRRGKYNYLINSKAEFDRTFRQANDFDVWLLAQQYIPNDGIYRLISLGGQVALIFKRSPDDGGSHLYSSSRGSTIQIVDPDSLPQSMLNLAPMSAKLMGLQIAGLDLIQDKVTKLWYCLEVNKAPQLYSGSFVKEKEAAVAKYLNQRLRN